MKMSMGIRASGIVRMNQWSDRRVIGPLRDGRP